MRVVFTKETIAHTSLPFLGDDALHVLPVFFSGAELLLLALPGLLVAHMATHLDIHFFLSKKLPSIPCLAPELLYNEQSCSHSRHVGHAREGFAQPSSSPPRSTGNACPPKEIWKPLFPWVSRQVQASAFASLAWESCSCSQVWSVPQLCLQQEVRTA